MAKVSVFLLLVPIKPAVFLSWRLFMRRKSRRCSVPLVAGARHGIVMGFSNANGPAGDTAACSPRETRGNYKKLTPI